MNYCLKLTLIPENNFLTANRGHLTSFADALADCATLISGFRL